MDGSSLHRGRRNAFPNNRLTVVAAKLWRLS